MNPSKSSARVTDDEYKKYRKSIEEMEKLILSAQESCERVGRIKASICSSACHTRRFSTGNAKKRTTTFEV